MAGEIWPVSEEDREMTAMKQDDNLSKGDGRDAARVLTAEEMPLSADLWMYSFGDTRAYVDWYYGRRACAVLAAFDQGELVSQIVCAPLDLSVRGSSRPGVMLSGVATAPAYRGKGHMSALMKAALLHLRDSGYATAVLYPFDYHYYERFGFARCGEVARVSVKLSSLEGLGADSSSGGRIHMLRGHAGLQDIVRAYEAAYCRYDGHTQRDERYFETLLGEPDLCSGYAVVYTCQGSAEGYMIYYMRDPSIVVHEIGAANDRARRALLTYLAGHASTMETAEFTCPLDDPLWRLIPDPRGAVSAEPYNMLRIVDVYAMMNGLPADDGDVTLRISDPAAPWNDGVWRLQARSGVLEVSKAGPADIPAISIGEFTRWVFGCAEKGRCTQSMERLLPARPFFMYEMY